jgi:hypothetical protein
MPLDTQSRNLQPEPALLPLGASSGLAKNFQCSTIDPVNPDGPRVEVIIPAELIERVYKYDPTQFENFRCAKIVLDDPKRIFAGVRPINDGWWCYTGRPSRWHIREEVTVDFPRSLIFAVYINSRHEVYEFRAEKADPVDNLNPIGWETRFGGLVWTSTS